MHGDKPGVCKDTMNMRSAEQAAAEDSLSAGSPETAEASIPKTPERRPQKDVSVQDTPLQNYVDYVLEGGPPSPPSSCDSPPTRKFKEWFRKQVEEEQWFRTVDTVYDGADNMHQTLEEDAQASAAAAPVPVEPTEEEEKEPENTGVASWSQPDPEFNDLEDAISEGDCPAPSVEPQETASHSMSVRDRLSALENRSRSPRARSFKHGSCPHHGTALRPHVWSQGSKKAGRGALVCSQFWKRDEATNKPCCWFFKEVSMSEAQQWPFFYRKQFNSLQNRFLRGGRQDWSPSRLDHSLRPDVALLTPKKTLSERRGWWSLHCRRTWEMINPQSFHENFWYHCMKRSLWRWTWTFMFLTFPFLIWNAFMVMVPHCSPMEPCTA